MMEEERTGTSVQNEALIEPTETLIQEEDKLNLLTGRGLKPKDFWVLLVRPKDFFGANIALLRRQYVVVAMFLIGIKETMGKIEKDMLQVDLGSSTHSYYMEVTQGSWAGHWSYLMFVGALSGLILWYLGGWWYNVRIQWSGEKDFDRDFGRAVYAYNGLIPAVALLVLLLFQTISYPDYVTAYYNEDIGMMEMVLSLSTGLFFFLAYINSYRSVIGVFKVKRWRAFVLFLLLPSLMASAGLVLYFLMAT